MLRYRAGIAALLLAGSVSCAGNGGGQRESTGTAGAAGGAPGTGGSAGSAAGTTGSAGSGGSADVTGTAGTGGDAGGTSGLGGPSGNGGALGGNPGAGGSSAGAGGGAGGSVGRGGNAGAGRGGATGAAGSGGNAGSSGSAGTTGAGGIPVPAGYKLVWSDEFDVDGRPNSANWKYEQGFVRNEEDQWYQSDNATVSGGLLVIEARREQKANPNYQAGSTDWKKNRQYAEYTSSSLLTSGLHSWQFGRFEMRGRIPTSAGMWPAWWTLGNSGQWPSNGEIDIMEFYQGKVLANVACGTATAYQAKWDSATKSLSSFNDSQWSSKFHVWRMDWDDTKIDLYLDDVLMNTSNLADMLNADGKSPFRQPAYMILNLAIGGQNGGDPSNTTFPARYEIDYVRVFQKM
jgi:beta-glucanase (GH16 family)